MTKSPSTPTDLSEQPQLAVLEVLESALQQSTLALIAAHPQYWQEEAFPGSGDPSEEDAYVTAIIFQIHALEGTLQCYRQSVQRLRDRSGV